MERPSRPSRHRPGTAPTSARVRGLHACLLTDTLDAAGPSLQRFISDARRSRERIVYLGDQGSFDTIGRLASAIGMRFRIRRPADSRQRDEVDELWLIPLTRGPLDRQLFDVIQARPAVANRFIVDHHGTAAVGIEQEAGEDALERAAGMTNVASIVCLYRDASAWRDVALATHDIVLRARPGAGAQSAR